ncbi:MAG: efflux transporter outer membrane subunit [Candidatus Accumulibacter sp.]|jgi:NodT family efflux transporter outer membrane factor (OMF) lipoprotein|nr:efflux transporter outer membrane subunit [Accumulibacter sp.]
MFQSITFVFSVWRAFAARRRMIPPAAAPVFALLFALGGCASLEQRQAEVMAAATVAVPGAWSVSAPPLSGSAPAPDMLAAWWRQFGDERLERLIDAALTDAPDARSAQARLRQARAQRALAVANLYPSLGVSASATRSRSGTGTGGSGKSQTLYTAGFDARWEPSIFGGLVDAADAAEADAAAAEAGLESTRASLAAEVALEYVNLRSSQQRLAFVRANVDSQAETLRISEWRELAGLVTRLDVEQARASLEQSRAALPGLEVARARAEHRLSVLTGQAPGRLRETLRDPLALPAPPDEIAVGIPADTLRQRPDVRAAELALRAEIARTAQSEAERYPSLSLSGSFNWRAFSLTALGGSGNLTRSLAASLAAPLFDAGRIDSRIAAQTAARDQAFVAWEKSLLVALEDVENAMSAYANGRDQVDFRRRAALAAASAATLSRAQYQAGLVDFQRVLESERARLTAQDNLVSAEAEVLTAVIQLYKALGGGWNAAGNAASMEPSRS